MSLIDSIRRDANKITTSNSGFSVPVLFTTNASYNITPVVVTVNAIATVIAITVDDQGTIIRGKNARIIVSESALVGLSYPVRNVANKVRIKDDYISFVTSSGNTYNGVIREVLPDETNGLITLLLGDNLL